MVSLKAALEQYTEAHFVLQRIYADEILGVVIDIKEKLAYIKKMKKLQKLYQEQHKVNTGNEDYVVLDTFYEDGEFNNLFKVLLDAIGTENVEKKIAIETIARLKMEEKKYDE